MFLRGPEGSGVAHLQHICVDTSETWFSLCFLNQILLMYESTLLRVLYFKGRGLLKHKKNVRPFDAMFVSP